jgi:hypothetical protein
MDHRKVDISGTSISCGVKQLHRIDDDIEGALYAIASDLYHPARGSPCAFFVMSDIVGEETATSKLLTYVAANNLGAYFTSKTEENPKTGNLIAVYVWAIEHATFKAWYAAKRIVKMKAVGA